MNPGKLRDVCYVLKRNNVKNAGGQQQYEYTEVAKLRGNFREIPSKDLLTTDIQVNTRSGTCLTRFFKGADETQYMKINDKDIYRVIGFNHNDTETKTTWAIELLKV